MVNVGEFLCSMLVKAPGAIVEESVKIRISAGDGHNCGFGGWFGRGYKYLLLRNKGGWSVEHTALVECSEEQTAIVLERWGPQQGFRQT